MCVLPFGLEGLWLRYATLPSNPAQSKERKGSNFAIWQPCSCPPRALPELITQVLPPPPPENSSLSLNWRKSGRSNFFGHSASRARAAPSLPSTAVAAADQSTDKEKDFASTALAFRVKLAPWQITSEYRVTHQVGSNFPLTSKQKFRFGLACPDLARPKRNFSFDVNGREV